MEQNFPGTGKKIQPVLERKSQFFWPLSCIDLEECKVKKMLCSSFGTIMITEAFCGIAILSVKVIKDLPRCLRFMSLCHLHILDLPPFLFLPSLLFMHLKHPLYKSLLLQTCVSWLVSKGHGKWTLSTELRRDRCKLKEDLIYFYNFDGFVGSFCYFSKTKKHRILETNWICRICTFIFAYS